jgi:hypothetical protein
MARSFPNVTDRTASAAIHLCSSAQLIVRASRTVQGMKPRTMAGTTLIAFGLVA